MPKRNEFGRWTSLREVEKSRTITISEHTWRRFVTFSKQHYNVETYEVILNDLLDSYEKNNKSDYLHLAEYNK